MKNFIFILLIGYTSICLSLVYPPKLNSHFSKDFNKRKIIDLNSNTKSSKWITIDELKKNYSPQPGKILSFIDITETENLEQGTTPSVPEIPREVKHQETVRKLLPEIEKNGESNLLKTIQHMSNYTTRYATSRTGVEAAEWLKGQYERIVNEIKDPLRRSLFNVSLVNHNSRSYNQPSVVVIMQGSESKELKVILGSHLDSTAGWFQNAPGADDDASGAASVLEIFRVIAQSDYVPKKTIEFHSYAAEEMGLLGSQDLASKYKKANEKVYVMMQMDMNGYNANSINQIALVRNGVTAEVTEFVKKCIDAYCEFRSREVTLSGGTSDHASWLRAGYRVCFPFEVVTNPNIHTNRDTLDKLDLKLSVQHLKMALGFVIETSA